MKDLNMVRQKLSEILDSKEQEIIQIRRWLHQHPELSFKEFETAEYIKKFYDDRAKDIEWLRYPVGENGIAVKIKGGHNNNTGNTRKTIAIRADFDALPMGEETDLPYKSLNPNAAHMCGHDAHTSVVLAVADALIEVKENLNGDVVILHQYAEETPPGGAKAMVEDGVLENVDAIIGGHVWSPQKANTIAVRTGMTMAGRTYFKVVLTGKGGHGSQPQECVDPIVAASHFVVAVQSIVGRNISPVDSAVVTIGRFDGAGRFNIIPNSVTLEGDVRSCSPDVSKLVCRRFKELLEGIAAAYNCTYELEYTDDYPPVINNGELAEIAKKMLMKNIVPGLTLQESNITMGSEDFSYYQEKIPGLFVFFGAQPNGEWYQHHHPKFNIDESCLVNSAKFFANFAVEFLNGE